MDVIQKTLGNILGSKKSFNIRSGGKNLTKREQKFENFYKDFSEQQTEFKNVMAGRKVKNYERYDDPSKMTPEEKKNQHELFRESVWNFANEDFPNDLTLKEKEKLRKRFGPRPRYPSA